MIDKRLLQLLESNDVEKRKKAVMALAQTKDREALPHLARVFKNDGSAEVRELAKKAGVYINKNALAEPEPEPEDDLYDYEYEDDYDADEEEDAGYGYEEEDDDDDAEDRLYGDDIYGEEDEDEEEDDIPLPSQVHVSDANRQTARSYINTAMDYNVRGENRKSADMVRRAFRLDPGLMHDGYSRSLASTITGLDPDEAVKLLGPSSDELRKQTKGSSESSATSTTLSGIFGILMISAAAMALFGYFILPWVTLADVRVESVNPLTGAVEQSTVGAQFDQQTAELNEMRGSDAFADRLIDAFNNISLEINGLDTTLVTLGVSDIFEVMGLKQFVELLGGEDVTTTEEIPAPRPLDYTLPLMPIMAVVTVLLSFFLIRTSRIRTWLIAVIIGLIGLAPLMYFYLDAVNSLLGEDTSLSQLGEASIESGADLLGMGFWFSFGGMLAIVIIPFLALLTMPAAES